MFVRAFSTFFLFYLFAISAASAQGLSTLVREPRSMAMGGSGVALADDEFALFHNPAGLAGIETRRFKIVGFSFEASLGTYEAVGTSIDVFKNFKIGSLNSLMGKDIALRADLIPIIQLPHFAITYFVDAQGGIDEYNQANPQFRIGEMITHGVQAGMGFNLLKERKASEDLRVGAAVKMLWRKGGYSDIYTAGFLQASKNGKQFLKDLVGEYGLGYGADLGIQYVKHAGKATKLYFGSSITDIGGTHFSDPRAMAMPMNTSIGVGAEKTLDLLKIKFDFDVRNLGQDVAFANKTHIGTELSFRLLDVDLGLNQFNLTYGVSFDVWVLKVSAMSFAEEYGITYHQNVSRKYLLQIDFSLPI